MTDLVRADIPPVVVDEADHFHLVLKQADVLAKSSIVPAAYRGKAADIVAAGLAGRAFGWDVMTSMRNYHVIEGAASLRPEAMLGLVRQAGHSVTIKNGPGEVVACGKRADTGDTYDSSFTMDDAQQAGLAGKRNWKQYPEAMLTWRAVSKLCRYLFPDVVLGAGLTPEELGAEVDSQGAITVEIEPVEPFPILAEASLPYKEAKAQLLEACHGDKDLARELWGDRGQDDVATTEVEALVSGAKELEQPQEVIDVEPPF